MPERTFARFGFLKNEFSWIYLSKNIFFEKNTFLIRTNINWHIFRTYHKKLAESDDSMAERTFAKFLLLKNEFSCMEGYC